ncbi:MAG TPA: hypothetical protein VG318_09620 [Actinomycetota bacterium]|nr:hypothetical protein [Actinomycetota bacterium]
MYRPLAVAVAIIVGAAGLTPSLAEELDGKVERPQLRRVNTFHSDGVSGIALEVPQKVRWFADNVEIELGKGTDAAWVAFRNRRRDAELCDLCFLGTFAQRWRRGPFGWLMAGACTGNSGRELGCAIPEGVSELYLMGDGPFTVTIRFPELRGALDLEASGAVDGEVRRVPPKCVTPDCALVKGSIVRKVGRGRPAYSQIQASVQGVRSERNPTVQNVTACAYPGYFNEHKSADPSDHPYGCDVADTRDASSDEFLFPFVTTGGGLGGVGVGAKTHGSQYLAYTIHHREAAPPSKVEAYAWFLNAGIRCASGTFFDC